MRRYIQTFLLLVSFGTANCFADMYRWVDENGKLNFGDSVPPQFTETAEKVELTPLNTLSPEDDVRMQNKATANRLRREDAIRSRRKNSVSASNTQSNTHNAEASVNAALEECRNQHLQVKERTECFRKANGQNPRP